MSDRRTHPVRLVLVISAGILLVFAALWLRNRTADIDPDVVNPIAQHVDLIDMDEYLLNFDLHVRVPGGKLKQDLILIPNPPERIEPQSPPSDGGYLGPESCAECHRDKYESFIQTAHYQTSAMATRENIQGSFEDGERVLATQSPNLSVEMTESEGKLVQRVLLETEAGTIGEEFEFGLITGSGKVGQTYLHWRGDHLYQLHASYLTAADSWMNSPGYHDGIADFARPTLSHCLECHSTYFQPVEGTLNQFQRENFVLGVTCEKCHGPGQEHVAYHQANPKDEVAKHIVNPDNLETQRALELCQMCHGGVPRILQPPFSYRPGEELGKYYEFSTSTELEPGIHSNTQLPRLSMSKCFTESDGEMTCAHCHNPHQFERGDLKLFSDRCMNCHVAEHCGEFDTIGSERIRENCIDCHMPLREMTDIVLMKDGEGHQPPMRDHFIKVWPAETKAFKETLEAK